MTQQVVVTGVSTGIGQSTAQVLAKQGMHVFGSVRRAADAQKLVDELGDQFTPLIFDITDVAAVQRAAQFVKEQLRDEPLTGLVNNAGIAVPGPLLHVTIDEYRHQIDVNLTGPLIVAQAFAPLLGATSDFTGKPGRIVMVSSVGGQIAGPFLGPYHASKFGLEGLSESLRRELMIYGIDVIVIEPGAVATPIWDKAEQIDVRRFADTDYASALETYKRFMIDDGRKGLPPERIGEAISKALTTPHPRVRYPVLRGRFFGFEVPRRLPARLVDRALARQSGLSQRPTHSQHHDTKTGNSR